MKETIINFLESTMPDFRQYDNVTYSTMDSIASIHFEMQFKIYYKSILNPIVELISKNDTSYEDAVEMLVASFKTCFIKAFINDFKYDWQEKAVRKLLTTLKIALCETKQTDFPEFICFQKIVK